MKSAQCALISSLLTAIFFAIAPVPAVAQNAEPWDAARTPSKPLRYETPEATKNVDSPTAPDASADGVQQSSPSLPPQRHPLRKHHDPMLGVSDDFSRRKFHVGATVQTIFPIFLGGGLEASYRNKLVIGAQYGLTPRAYSNAIAEAAAAFANEPSYREIVKAAFEKNSILRLFTEYRFGSHPRGWRLGAAYSLLDSSGSAPIDSSVEPATGLDFTLLKQLLGLQNEDLVINMDATLGLGELYIGYGWRHSSGFTFGLDLGVAKVFASRIHLKTDAPSYDNSANGREQLREAESDLEQILKKYGLTPTLALRAGYSF